MSRGYFDQAATSFPKPPAVAAAVQAYLTDVGVPAGRGSYRQAVEVDRRLQQCRQQLARMWSVPDPRQVVFTFNGTDSLNLALLGLLRPDDHVVTTTWEHNSVLRPLRMLQEQRNVTVTFLEPDANGQVQPAEVQQALRDKTRLVAIQHANNVIGVLQPIAEIGAVVAAHGACFLVDAAQSAGHVPIDMSSMNIDLLACPGHKGLLGPLGTGVLALSRRTASELPPLRYGGTGTNSEDDRQPAELPEKYEAGNLNVPGLLGLAAAVDWLLAQNSAAAHERSKQQVQQLWTALSDCPGLELLGPSPDDVPRTAVLALQFADFDPRDAAAILDESFGIQCRAGLHCAPGVHRWLGTFARGGCVRVSLGHFTTDEDVATLQAALLALASGG